MAANKIKKRNEKLIAKNKSIIDALEIGDDFRKLPADLRSSILSLSWPKLSIDIEESKNFNKIQEIQNNILNSICDLKIKIKNKNIPLLDLGYLLGVDSSFYSIKYFIDKKPFSFKYDKVKLYDTLDRLEKTSKKHVYIAWREYILKIILCSWKEISKHYIFTKDGLYFSIDIGKSPGKKIYPIIKIHQYNHVKRNFNMSGKPRDAYLCFSFNELKMNPIILKENTINNFKPTPVYIQDHAINRLKERLKIDESQLGDLYYNLGSSLLNPDVVGKDKDSYLISFYLNHINLDTRSKLGYLVLDFAEEVALIKSFKFITMTGTPEHKLLKSHLGASRIDLEYFKLDSIDFLNSDVFQDSDLRRIFKKCNLSHLLDIKNQIKFDTPEFSFADDMKNYFRL